MRVYKRRGDKQKLSFGLILLGLHVLRRRKGEEEEEEKEGEDQTKVCFHLEIICILDV